MEERWEMAVLGKERGSKAELPWSDLRFSLAFDLWRKDAQFHLC